jgi:hypothetical protein
MNERAVRKWRWVGAALIGLELAIGAVILASPISQMFQTERIIVDREAFEPVPVSPIDSTKRHESWVTVEGIVTGRGQDHSVFVVPDAVFCLEQFLGDEWCLDSAGASGWVGEFEFTLKRSSVYPMWVVASGCAPQEMDIHSDIYALPLSRRRGDHLVVGKRVTLDCPERAGSAHPGMTVPGKRLPTGA